MTIAKSTTIQFDTNNWTILQFKAILFFGTLFMRLVCRIIPPSKTIQSTKPITNHD